MTSCYEYKTYTCDDPWLRGVPRAYVLTMGNSKRLADGARLKTLCRMSKTTVVQFNHKDRVDCHKPECTRKSNFDLVHAYQAACRHASDLDGGPVLFLEDDAVVRDDATRCEFDLVNEFVTAEAFDVYTLGSIGIVPPWGRVGDHFAMLMVWHTQATIWSQPTRAKLLAADVSTLPHVDAHFLSPLKRKFKFKRPLIVQTFPESENSKSWCLHCRDDALGTVEKWGVGVWTGWYRGVLALDQRPLPGWDVLNLLTHLSFGLLAMVTCVVCGLVVALLWRFGAARTKKCTTSLTGGDCGGGVVARDEPLLQVRDRGRGHGRNAAQGGDPQGG